MKLQKIGDIQPTLPFTEYDFLKKFRESFAVSELGRIHAMLPLKEMAEELASHFPKKHPQGNKPLFPPEGELALMFLKVLHYWMIPVMMGANYLLQLLVSPLKLLF